MPRCDFGNPRNFPDVNPNDIWWNLIACGDSEYFGMFHEDLFYGH